MSIVLLGSTSGSVTLQEQAVAGTSVLTLPVGTGTVVANNVNSAIVSGTAVASTSGTSIDFTSIPSWVKRITVMFSSASTNGSSPLIVRVGTSGGIISTGYNASAFYSGTAGQYNLSTVGFPLTSTSFTAAGNSYWGQIVISSLSSTIWTANGSLYTDGSGGLSYWLAGAVSFSGTLDRVRLTTTNGTDTFDAGTINILYE
jgi:hypothetical protein